VKYLKLRISSDVEGQNILYEKDVDVRDVFESFIRSEVSALVRDGTIYEGEHYSAIVIPRYGNLLRRTPVLAVDAAKVTEKTQWIEMRFEEPLQPDRPVRYFTIELRIKERNLVYRQDFQTIDVGRYYVAYGVEQALLRLGVLRHGDYYYPTFFARDDKQAQFDRERIPPLEKRATSLVELIPEQPSALAFPYRDPAVYGETEVVGEVGPEDIRIFIGRRTLDRIVEEAKRIVEVERGGILVGQVYAGADGGRHIVEISDFIVSDQVVSSVSELRYTFESWRASSALMKEKYPGKRIVGWYHTHLIELTVYTDESRTTVEQTRLFFSRDDLFLHKRFFPDEWYVAMVLDPQGNHIFFQWKGGDIVACGGYRIFEDEGIAG